VSIDLSQAGGVLSLEVSDNGRGLRDADLAKARSFGIRGLHERASMVGGWVDLSSGPQGTTLILSIPLDAALDRAAELEAEDENRVNAAENVDDPSAWGSP
jgi:signal transduction histidine kinase